MPQVEWITKDAAAQELNLSVRRIQDLAKGEKIKSKLEKNPATGHKTLMLDAGSVAAYQAQQEQAANLPAVLRSNGASNDFNKIARLAAEVFRHDDPPAKFGKPDASWLTLDQAALYSGLPRSFLRSLIDSGKLAAFDTGPRSGGRYRVAKKDLDALQGERLTGQQREIERMP